MSLIIESLDDVRNLVKCLGIKVNNIEELKELLNAIKAQNDPEATRHRIIKNIAGLGIGIPTFLAAVVSGGLITTMTTMTSPFGTPFGSGFYIAIFGIVWGVAGLISLTSLAFAMASFGAARRYLNSTSSPRSTRSNAHDHGLMSGNSLMKVSIVGGGGLSAAWRRTPSSGRCG